MWQGHTFDPASAPGIHRRPLSVSPYSQNEPLGGFGGFIRPPRDVPSRTMSELPGTSAVSIESVEWSAEGAGNLTVRITGRWRRRRPVSTGQPTLVIEAEGRRHRYPAMPEPPSVGGTGPGVWRLSFTIPGWMAPELGRTWLQFGTVIVPLPIAVPAPGEGSVGDIAAAPEPPPAPPPSERAPPPRTFEPDPEEPEGPPDFDQARGVEKLTQRVDALEDELRDARAVRDELAASLEERE